MLGHFKRSVSFNMEVGDPDFEASARLFVDGSKDKTKGKRKRT